MNEFLFMHILARIICHDDIWCRQPRQETNCTNRTIHLTDECNHIRWISGAPHRHWTWFFAFARPYTWALCIVKYQVGPRERESGKILLNHIIHTRAHGDRHFWFKLCIKTNSFPAPRGIRGKLSSLPRSDMNRVEGSSTLYCICGDETMTARRANKRRLMNIMRVHTSPLSPCHTLQIARNNTHKKVWNWIG